MCNLTPALAPLAAAILALAVAVPAQPQVTQPPVPPPISALERAAVEAVLANAPNHGLPGAPAGLGDSELLSRLLAHAAAQYGARVTPRATNSQWGVAPPAPPATEAMTAALAEGRLGAWAQALAPGDPAYGRLVAQRRRYAILTEAGGWPQIPAGPALRADDTDPRVGLLRLRLRAEGYGSSDIADPQFLDPTLLAAIARYQVARGLEPDGVVGPATLAALNITAADRLAQIDANLERWRWLPRQLPAERIEVNIAAAEAVYFREDRPALSMRVVVGDSNNHTPLFYSAVDSIVINPPWNVPDRIARNEILPRAARDPGYLRRNNFSQIGGRLVQAPGPGSALGLFKFDFPSPYGVYLHDTPGKAAFDQRERFLSHGCVRLQKPRELALALLARQGMDEAAIDAAITARATRRVPLDRTVPLFMVYRSAEGLGDGSIIFRRDVYGWDRDLVRALGPSPYRVAEAPSVGTDCADTALSG